MYNLAHCTKGHVKSTAISNNLQSVIYGSGNSNVENWYNYLASPRLHHMHSLPMRGMAFSPSIVSYIRPCFLALQSPLPLFRL